jgi:hypothetical protein
MFAVQGGDGSSVDVGTPGLMGMALFGLINCLERRIVFWHQADVTEVLST